MRKAVRCGAEGCGGREGGRKSKLITKKKWKKGEKLVYTIISIGDEKLFHTIISIRGRTIRLYTLLLVSGDEKLVYTIICRRGQEAYLYY